MVRDCAWVTLVMRGDSYTGGALAMAFSMRQAGTRAALVCMVTEDVSEVAREQLCALFDQVVSAPMISYRCKPLKTDKQRRLYDWVSDGFTKWACLSLTQFRRVCFIDADKVVLANCDHIFELPAPAATFSSPWASPFGRGRGRGMFNPYWQIPNIASAARKLKSKPQLENGDVVPAEAIRAGFERDSFVAIGTMMLLAPAAGALEEFRAFVESNQPFGFPGCHSMMDEQSIVRFYFEKGVPWHFIHQRYNYIPWHRSWLPDVVEEGATRPDSPALFHYFGKKVWFTPRTEWADAEVWWRFAAAAARAAPAAAGAFAPELLALPGRRVCAWCESSGLPADHDLVDESGHVACPQFAKK